MSWPALKIKLTDQAAVAAYIQGLAWRNWRPTRIVIHNTAAPTQAQWAATESTDKAKGLVPGITRIGSLENYFWKEQDWSGAPHFFVDDDAVWVFNDPTKPGTHSPSWNSTSIGIEMIADFAREDDDSGPGLKIRNNTIHLVAILCAELGIDPATHVNLHKDDPKTTHDCPGKDFADDRKVIIREIMALMPGGEHQPDAVAIAIGAKLAPVYPEWKGVVTVDDLTVRKGAGVSFKKITAVLKGAALTVLGEMPNAETKWLHVRYAGANTGWVAGRFVRKA